MGYTPVKGGAAAIRAAGLLVQPHPGDGQGDGRAGWSVGTVQGRLGAAVDRVMGEGGCTRRSWPPGHPST